MQDERYVGRGGFNPASFGAAVAINGVVLAALVFAAPVAEIIHVRPPTFIDFIPIDPPPPPEPQPKADPARPTERTVYVPHQEVATPNPKSDQVAVTDEFPPVAPPAGPADTGVTVDSPATPLPALIGAQPDPRYAADFQPDYPAAEIRAERSGRVVVRVLIGVDGRVQAVERVSATSDAFFEATRRRALARWRFRPATRGGVPEPAWRTMAVNFVLEDAR